MNTKKIYTGLAIIGAALVMTSCGDSFLDTMPDNRAEVDEQEKVQYLLTSAYSDRTFNMLGEYMSDNCDDYSASSPNTTRYVEEVYFWKDVTESNNESPENVWQVNYLAIATANQALQSIDDIVAKSGWTTNLREARGEALLCRAYSHFILLNLFALNYDKATADKTPGITYMLKPETELNPKYERNTVAKCYELLAQDIEEGISLVGSSYYTVPKYHFTPIAAHAFACRFYLYYEKWDEAIDHANIVLGANPKTMLRNYDIIGAETTILAAAQKYIDATANCNLMLTTALSYMGSSMSNSSRYKRFTHTPYISANETATATHPWGSIATTGYRAPLKSYSSSTSRYHIFWRVPNLFEYTDPVAGTGYYRTVFPVFTADEVLLNRAEAYIMKENYVDACKDLNLWVENMVTPTAGAKTLTAENIQEFYTATDPVTGEAKVPYCYENVGGEIVSTPRKHLHPAFKIDVEGSKQECMLQCVLNARRIETLQSGLRWFDIKRYGIEIPRRTYNAAGSPEVYTDWLKVDDPRRAVQIPLKVRDAGYEANPRVKAIPEQPMEGTPDTEDTEGK